MTKINCSGALIYSKSTNRVLLLQKSSGKHVGKWSIVGGTNNNNESDWQCLIREIQEELGFLPEFIKSIPLDRFVSNDNQFNFNTYFCIVSDEFIPKLSDEHCSWAWADIEYLPKPIHRGLYLSLKNKTIQNKIKTIIEIIDLL